jgi:hypothetical protein
MAQTASFDWSSVVDYAKRERVETPKTQYELPGVTIEEHGDEAVPVVVVPLWHAVVTAKLTIPREREALQAAQRRLATALEEIERIYPLAPQGLFIQVAYGLPYFRNYLPSTLTDRYMPRSVEQGSEGQWAVGDSIRFPKDP